MTWSINSAADESVTYDMTTGAYVRIEDPTDSVKSGYHGGEEHITSFFFPEATAGFAIR
jgi:hypothetical protein